MMGEEEEIEECVVEYAGMRVKAPCLPQQGVFFCPVCLASGQSVLFYTGKDLMHHLMAHAEGYVHTSGHREARRRARRGTLLDLEA